MFRSFDGHINFIDIVTGSSLVPYLFILYLDYILQTSIDLIKNVF